MRFLIDAQLPPDLARQLTGLGHEAEHVADCGLLDAPDERIWSYAVTTGMVIVTKDRDFADTRSLRDGPQNRMVAFREYPEGRAGPPPASPCK